MKFKNDIEAQADISVTGDVNIGGAGQTNRKLKVHGNASIDGGLYLTGASTSYSVEVGQSRSVDGVAFLDLTGEVAPDDYGLRMIRYGGLNAESKIIHTGTANLTINASNGADTVFTNTDVGIGTTNPEAKLDVSASVPRIRLSATSAGYSNGNTTGAIDFYNSDESSEGEAVNAKVEAYADGVFGDLGLRFFTGGNGNPTQKITIDKDGDVGIGTDDPSELLHLSSTGPARLLIEADTDNVTETDNAQIILKQDGGAVVGRLGFKNNSNSLEMWNESNEALIFGTNNTQRLYISGSGTSTFSAELKIGTTGGRLLTLKDINSAGDASTAYMAFHDSLDVRQGYIGMGSSGNSKLYLEGLDGIQANQSMTVNGDLTVTDNILGADFIQLKPAGTVENDCNSIGYDSTSDFSYLDNDGDTVYLNHYGIGINRPTGSSAPTGMGLYMAGYFGLNFFTSGTNRLSIAQSGESTFYKDLTISNTGSARLILNGDSNNVGDAGQEDAIIDFLGDGGSYGYRLNTENYSLKTAFNFQENKNGIYTSRLYIDKDGNPGIGTTSPLAKFHINNTEAWSMVSLGTCNNVKNAFRITGRNSATNSLAIGSFNNTDYVMQVVNNAGNVSGQMLINPYGGNVGINTASPNSQSKLHITTQNYNTGCRIDGPTGQTFGFMGFYAGGSYRGGISPTATGVNYSSGSDYRLKENVIKLQNSTERIKKLKPSNFNFLENPSETVDGFIAHELQEIVPEAVTGKKDAVGFDGEPNYQGVDQSKIVPLLTAALQEAISKIEQLETRIQILENK